MRDWTACIAHLGVTSHHDVRWLKWAQVGVAPLAPLTHLLPGGTAVGAVRGIALSGDHVIATGSCNADGARLISSGQWLPEVDLDPRESDGVRVGRVTVMRRAIVMRIVLGQLTVWDDLWIRLAPHAAVP